MSDGAMGVSDGPEGSTPEYAVHIDATRFKADLPSTLRKFQSEDVPDLRNPKECISRGVDPIAVEACRTVYLNACAYVASCLDGAGVEGGRRPDQCRTQFLLLQGVPGTGKSLLCQMLLYALLNTPKVVPFLRNVFKFAVTELTPWWKGISNSEVNKMFELCHGGATSHEAGAGAGAGAGPVLAAPQVAVMTIDEMGPLVFDCHDDDGRAAVSNFCELLSTTPPGSVSHVIVVGTVNDSDRLHSAAASRATVVTVKRPSPTTFASIFKDKLCRYSVNTLGEGITIADVRAWLEAFPGEAGIQQALSDFGVACQHDIRRLMEVVNLLLPQCRVQEFSADPVEDILAFNARKREAVAQVALLPEGSRVLGNEVLVGMMPTCTHIVDTLRLKTREVRESAEYVHDLVLERAGLAGIADGGGGGGGGAGHLSLSRGGRHRHGGSNSTETGGDGTGEGGAGEEERRRAHRGVKRHASRSRHSGEDRRSERRRDGAHRRHRHRRRLGSGSEAMALSVHVDKEETEEYEKEGGEEERSAEEEDWNPEAWVMGYKRQTEDSDDEEDEEEEKEEEYEGGGAVEGQAEEDDDEEDEEEEEYEGEEAIEGQYDWCLGRTPGHVGPR